jgi:hypothetical protein
LRVISPAFGGTAVRALRLRVISIRPSWISSIDSGARLLVEMLQGGGGQPRLRRVAADPAMLAAAADGDIEGGFDLAQVLVQRAAEVLQTRVVERLQWQGSGRAGPLIAG